MDKLVSYSPKAVGLNAPAKKLFVLSNSQTIKFKFSNCDNVNQNLEDLGPRVTVLVLKSVSAVYL